MENDFNFTKDYMSMFNDAKKLKNIDRMSEIFKEMAGEAGVSDPLSSAAQSEAGKRIAERHNLQQKNGGLGKAI